MQSIKYCDMSINGRIKTRRDFIKQSAMTTAMLPFLFSCGQSSSKSLLDQDAIKKFRSMFTGQIILPGDKDYETRRWSQIINPTMDKHPAIISVCKNEDDILRSIAFAREHQLEIAVRSGNHSNMGWGTCEKGMVIDVSKMKRISVDANKKIAIVQTGATAEEILAATARYGLAPVLGECGSVGSGLALGGGLGWLSGKYGATCDNLISANIITAGAEIRNANSADNEDLFWAIRGGGGNFGIASSFVYQLHTVKEMLRGSFIYPIRNAYALIKFFDEFMAAAPDELQADCYLSRDTCLFDVVYFGELDAGERLLDNFRKFSKPDKDSVKRGLFSEVYNSPDDEATVTFRFNAVKGTYIEQLSEAVIKLIIERINEAPSAAVVQSDFSHYMHGQVCRVLPDATAFELRKLGGVHFVFWLQWQNSSDTEACLKWQNETFEQLQRYAVGRIYTNYMSQPGGSTAKAVFGTNFLRLKQVKKKYDADNIFHLNQNILPD
jgi:hypothetical protein